MNDIKKQPTIADIYALKLRYVEQCKQLEENYQACRSIMDELGQYTNLTIQKTDDRYTDDGKYFDKKAWSFLAKAFNVKKYMLCSEWDKLQDDITYGRIPEFTIETAQGWLNGLNLTVIESVKQMLESIYDEVCNGTYYVGRERKKRNNNGIDKFFILRTNDYYNMFTWYTFKNTITDDLEKVCYILDGKQVPEITIKEQMRRDKVIEMSNNYFTIKVAKNGNTHYKLTDETWARLNKVAGNKNAIGTDIKIKVFG